MTKRMKCEPSQSSPDKFLFCGDLNGILELYTKKKKGLLQKGNLVLAKQGEHIDEGLPLNYCPFCGEPVRAKPLENITDLLTKE